MKFLSVSLFYYFMAHPLHLRFRTQGFSSRIGTRLQRAATSRNAVIQCGLTSQPFGKSPLCQLDTMTGSMEVQRHGLKRAFGPLSYPLGEDIKAVSPLRGFSLPRLLLSRSSSFSSARTITMRAARSLQLLFFIFSVLAVAFATPKPSKTTKSSTPSPTPTSVCSTGLYNRALILVPGLIDHSRRFRTVLRHRRACVQQWRSCHSRPSRHRPWGS